MTARLTEVITRGFLLGMVCLLLMSCMPTHAPAASAEEKFYTADACYQKIKKSASKKKYRHNWETCIKKYYSVYEHDPSGPWAAAGLFMCGQLYYGLSGQSGLTSDASEARAYYQRIVQNYPDSRYNSKSQTEIAAIDKKFGTQVATASRNSTTAKSSGSDGITSLIRKNTQVATGSTASTGTPTTVEGIRYWSNTNYTRVVIDADKETTYAYRKLNEDPNIDKPQRLYVDLTNSLVGSDLPTEVPINDNLLISARAGQHTKEQVRVVVDIKSFESYNVFPLKNPFRIVIDVWGENGGAGTSGSVALGATSQEGTATNIDLRKQFALGVRKIVVDPGHGGKDTGAIGYQKGVYEKDITLKLSKNLAAKLESELGCEVVMTRTTDKYLTLEERTAIANTENADLFISVHTNSHTDKRAYGIETYLLNLATDNEAIAVAARENATSARNISDLDDILDDMWDNMRVNESSQLAALVQNAIISGLKNKSYTNIKDKGVKQAPFYVLLGARAPAILVEASFISNKTECARLLDSGYQNDMVDSIVEGVRKWINETNPTALFSQNPNQG